MSAALERRPIVGERRWRLEVWVAPVAVAAPLAVAALLVARALGTGEWRSAVLAAVLVGGTVPFNVRMLRGSRGSPARAPEPRTLAEVPRGP